MDQHKIQVVDVGAGQAGLNVAAYAFEETITVISGEILSGIVAFSFPASDGLFSQLRWFALFLP